MYPQETEDEAVARIAECLNQHFPWFYEKGWEFKGMVTDNSWPQGWYAQFIMPNSGIKNVPFERSWAEDDLDESVARKIRDRLTNYLGDDRIGFRQ
ncbi:MAG: hypothetical protein Q7N50_14615 [Armatimonadota bacterium]|nr:hypothetical protein [Armatimonadota bacterium]